MKKYDIENFEIGIGCELGDIEVGNNSISREIIKRTKQRLFYKTKQNNGGFCWFDVLTKKKYFTTLKIKTMKDVFDLSDLNELISGKDIKKIAKIVELVQDFDRDRPKIRLELKRIDDNYYYM
ncbi:MAG: hypothetical protein WCR30_00645 [Clostridia bacterium]